MKLIHQVVISDANLDGFVPKNKENLEQHCADYDYILWDYAKIKKFILDNGDQKVLKAIDSVKANAFKADIARYYIVHKMGGWYIDLNNYFKEPPPEDYDILAFAEDGMPSGAPWSVQNGFFYFNKKDSPQLLNVVDICVDNVENRVYGFNEFCPTGPLVFGRGIAHALPEGSKHFFGQYIVARNGMMDGFYMSNFFNSVKKPLALYKPYHKINATGKPGIPGANNYVEMWKNRELY